MPESSKIAVPLRWRPMQPADVEECVAIVAAHPVIGPRYGADIENLGRAWRQLLGSPAVNNAVIERLDQKRARVVGVGFAVFVRDEFMREIKTPPLVWVGPELARRVTGRDSPVLTDDEVRDANSGAGLSEIVWEGTSTPEFAHAMDFYHHLVGAYVQAHRGFLLKEMIPARAESVERLLWVVESGALYWNPARQRYETTSSEPPEFFAARPHLLGITRELVRPGSWIGTLFDYDPPRFGFSRGEQQLLLMALASFHGTDQELAGALHLSVPTVKKMWGSIYRRVADCDPELVPGSTLAESGMHERGQEKRRSLLAYVREHRGAAPAFTQASEAEPASDDRRVTSTTMWSLAHGTTATLQSCRSSAHNLPHVATTPWMACGPKCALAGDPMVSVKFASSTYAEPGTSVFDPPRMQIVTGDGLPSGRLIPFPVTYAEPVTAKPPVGEGLKDGHMVFQSIGPS